MKLNKKQHVSKVEKADLKQAKTNLEKQNKHLKPAKYLSKKGKEYFKIIAEYLEKQSVTSSIDSLQVNQLAMELASYDIASQFIAKQGLIINDKKNPIVAVRNNALKNAMSLSSALGLTINGRIKANLMDVQQGNTSDPLAEVFSDKK